MGEVHPLQRRRDWYCKCTGPFFRFIGVVSNADAFMLPEGGGIMPKTTKPGLIEFGNRLCAMRESLGLSQKQLGDKLNIDNRQISRYETGQVEMGAMLYERFLELYHGEKDRRTELILQQCTTLTNENKEQLLNIATALNIAQSQR